jgi:hypothetical protein
MRTQAARPVAIGLRLFRLLAAAYPHEFRNIYGEDMLRMAEHPVETVPASAPDSSSAYVRCMCRKKGHNFTSSAGLCRGDQPPWRPACINGRHAVDSRRNEFGH